MKQDKILFYEFKKEHFLKKIKIRLDFLKLSKLHLNFLFDMSVYYFIIFICRKNNTRYQIKKNTN